MNPSFSQTTNQLYNKLLIVSLMTPLLCLGDTHYVLSEGMKGPAVYRILYYVARCDIQPRKVTYNHHMAQ